MNAERLLELYERIADAPDAISSLRRFMLDLAIRGKLVSQESSDEPMSDLFRRKGLAYGVTGPFELPVTWVWTNVGAVADARLGKMLDKAKNRGEPRPYLRNVNVRWFDFDLSDLLEMRFEESELPEYELRAGDVLICEGGEPGRAAVWDERERQIYFQKAIHRVRFERVVNPYFFVRALRASANDGRLAGHFTGTGIRHFTGKGLHNYTFPVPPVMEQERIVAKLDQMMALCDELEAARKGREASRDRFTAASLARLDDSDPSLAAFAEHARFATANVTALTQRAQQIKQVRKAILSLAVRGRLVQRDANDEPASEMMKRIAEARQRRGLSNDTDPIDAGDAPFRLPSNWGWSRLGSICSKTGSGSTPRGGEAVYKKIGIPFLRSQNIYNEGLRLHDVAFIDEQTQSRMSGTTVVPGDLLLNITGGSIGRCGRVPPDFGRANVSQHVAIIRPALPELTDFLHLVVLSPYFQGFIFTEQTGAGRGGLPKNKMDAIAVALPPVAEQQRICARVSELMVVCDGLEASLTVRDDVRQRLFDALLSDALASSRGVKSAVPESVAAYG
jgi:type I restriction enzyme S subunit